MNVKTRRTNLVIVLVLAGLLVLALPVVMVLLLRR